MAKYTFTELNTGKPVEFEWYDPSPPTDADLEQISAEARKGWNLKQSGMTQAPVPGKDYSPSGSPQPFLEDLAQDYSGVTEGYSGLMDKYMGPPKRLVDMLTGTALDQSGLPYPAGFRNGENEAGQLVGRMMEAVNPIYPRGTAAFTEASPQGVVPRFIRGATQKAGAMMTDPMMLAAPESKLATAAFLPGMLQGTVEGAGRIGSAVGKGDYAGAAEELGPTVVDAGMAAMLGSHLTERAPVEVTPTEGAPPPVTEEMNPLPTELKEKAAEAAASPHRERVHTQMRESFSNVSAPQMDVALWAMDKFAARVLDTTGIDFYDRLTKVERASEPGNRGETEIFLNKGTSIIRAFEAHDFSTAIHELTHAVRPLLGRGDLAILEGWLGVEGGKWTKKHDEALARAHEMYTKTGKAPTPELMPVFAKMKQWMGEIYARVKGGLRGHPDYVKMTPEVRGLFDEIYSSKPRPSVEKGFVPGEESFTPQDEFFSPEEEPLVLKQAQEKKKDPLRAFGITEKEREHVIEYMSDGRLYDHIPRGSLTRPEFVKALEWATKEREKIGLGRDAKAIPAEPAEAEAMRSLGGQAAARARAQADIASEKGLTAPFPETIVPEAWQRVAALPKKSRLAPQVDVKGEGGGTPKQVGALERALSAKGITSAAAIAKRALSGDSQAKIMVKQILGPEHDWSKILEREESTKLKQPDDEKVVRGKFGMRGSLGATPESRAIYEKAGLLEDAREGNAAAILRNVAIIMENDKVDQKAALAKVRQRTSPPTDALVTAALALEDLRTNPSKKVLPFTRDEGDILKQDRRGEVSEERRKIERRMALRREADRIYSEEYTPLLNEEDSARTTFDDQPLAKKREEAFGRYKGLIDEANKLKQTAPTVVPPAQQKVFKHGPIARAFNTAIETVKSSAVGAVGTAVRNATAGTAHVLASSGAGHLAAFSAEARASKWDKLGRHREAAEERAAAKRFKYVAKRLPGATVESATDALADTLAMFHVGKGSKKMAEQVQFLKDAGQKELAEKIEHFSTTNVKMGDKLDIVKKALMPLNILGDRTFNGGYLTAHLEAFMKEIGSKTYSDALWKMQVNPRLKRQFGWYMQEAGGEAFKTTWQLPFANTALRNFHQLTLSESPVMNAAALFLDPFYKATFANLYAGMTELFPTPQLQGGHIMPSLGEFHMSKRVRNSFEHDAMRQQVRVLEDKITANPQAPDAKLWKKQKASKLHHMRELEEARIYNIHTAQARMMVGPALLALSAMYTFAKGDKETEFDELVTKRDDKGHATLGKFFSGSMGEYLFPIFWGNYLGHYVRSQVDGTPFKYEGKEGMTKLLGSLGQSAGGSRYAIPSPSKEIVMELLESVMTSKQLDLKYLERLGLDSFASVGRMAAGGLPLDIARLAAEHSNPEERFSRRTDTVEGKGMKAKDIPGAVTGALARGFKSRLPGVRLDMPKSPNWRDLDYSHSLSPVTDAVTGLSTAEISPISRFVNAHQGKISMSELLPKRTGDSKYDDIHLKEWIKEAQPLMGLFDKIKGWDEELQIAEVLSKFKEARADAQKAAQKAYKLAEGKPSEGVQKKLDKKKDERELKKRLRVQRRATGSYSPMIPSQP